MQNVSAAEFRTGFPIVCAFLVILIVYLLSMPTQFITGDSAVEMNIAASGVINPRSNHLLTSTFYGLVIRLATILGIHDRPFLVAQSANAVIGAFCALILYKILILLGTGQALSLLLMIAFGIFNGTWIHSVNAETGIHPLLFWILSILCWLQCVALNRRSTLFFTLTLVTASMSVLFALNMLLFMPVLFATLLIHSLRAKTVQLSKMLLISLIVFVAFLAIPFGTAAYLKGVRTLPEFSSWMLEHPESARLTHIGHSATEGLLRAAAGAISGFVDTRGGVTIVKLAIRGESLRGTGQLSFVGLSLGCAILLIVIYLSMRGLLTRTNRYVGWFCSLGLLSNIPFSARWLGSDPQFWLPCLPLFIMLAAPGLGAPRTSRARVPYYVLWPAILVSLLAMNVPHESPSIIYPKGGRELRDAHEFSNLVSRGDVLFTPGFSWAVLIDRERPGVRRIDLVYGDLGEGERFLADVDARISSALRAHHRVYFDGIQGPRFASQYGAWEMFQSVRSVSRERLLKHLQERFSVEPVTASPQGRMSSVSYKG